MFRSFMKEYRNGVALRLPLVAGGQPEPCPVKRQPDREREKELAAEQDQQWLQMMYAWTCTEGVKAAVAPPSFTEVEHGMGDARYILYEIFMKSMCVAVLEKLQGTYAVMDAQYCSWVATTSKTPREYKSHTADVLKTGISLKHEVVAFFRDILYTLQAERTLKIRSDATGDENSHALQLCSDATGEKDGHALQYTVVDSGRDIDADVHIVPNIEFSWDAGTVVCTIAAHLDVLATLFACKRQVEMLRSGVDQRISDYGHALQPDGMVDLARSKEQERILENIMEVQIQQIEKKLELWAHRDRECDGLRSLRDMRSVVDQTVELSAVEKCTGAATIMYAEGFGTQRTASLQEAASGPCSVEQSQNSLYGRAWEGTQYVFSAVLGSCNAFAEIVVRNTKSVLMAKSTALVIFTREVSDVVEDETHDLFLRKMNSKAWEKVAQEYEKAEILHVAVFSGYYYGHNREQLDDIRSQLDHYEDNLKILDVFLLKFSQEVDRLIQLGYGGMGSAGDGEHHLFAQGMSAAFRELFKDDAEAIAALQSAMLWEVAATTKIQKYGEMSPSEIRGLADAVDGVLQTGGAVEEFVAVGDAAHRRRGFRFQQREIIMDTPQELDFPDTLCALYQNIMQVKSFIDKMSRERSRIFNKADALQRIRCEAQAIEKLMKSHEGRILSIRSAWEHRVKLIPRDKNRILRNRMYYLCLMLIQNALLRGQYAACATLQDGVQQPFRSARYGELLDISAAVAVFRKEIHRLIGLPVSAPEATAGAACDAFTAQIATFVAQYDARAIEAVHLHATVAYVIHFVPMRLAIDIPAGCNFFTMIGTLTCTLRLLRPMLDTIMRQNQDILLQKTAISGINAQVQQLLLQNQDLVVRIDQMMQAVCSSEDAQSYLSRMRSHDDHLVLIDLCTMLQDWATASGAFSCEQEQQQAQRLSAQYTAERDIDGCLQHIQAICAVLQGAEHAFLGYLRQEHSILTERICVSKLYVQLGECEAVLAVQRILDDAYADFCEKQLYVQLTDMLEQQATVDVSRPMLALLGSRDHMSAATYAQELKAAVAAGDFGELCLQSIYEGLAQRLSDDAQQQAVIVDQLEEFMPSVRASLCVL